ncbi:hypothetical protein PI124_g5946 [Phytophthora idaei]|nr:hypothetical protein PI125_g13471 [Phytophthora idaei]KAG3148218.1 hypothetical protein PI126_g12532 [Phytophthora idaei]KAG3249380.1 hypothetical protein PI124_g5946 [Phytophthora idaei]
MADHTRVPSNLPKYTGKRREDVREWLFQIENACRINNVPIEDTSSRLPRIAGSAMEKPASGWFLSLLEFERGTTEHPDDEKRRHLGCDGWSILVINDGPDVRVLPSADAGGRYQVHRISSAERTLGISGFTHGSLQRTSYHASVDINTFPGLEADEVDIKTFPGLVAYEVHLRRHLLFTKSPKIEDHLEALRETLDILRDNKRYVKLSKCVFCADEIPCLGDFVSR